MSDRCTVCSVRGADARKGQCDVPIPAPQPPDCLMAALERDSNDAPLPDGPSDG